MTALRCPACQGNNIAPVIPTAQSDIHYAMHKCQDCRCRGFYGKFHVDLQEEFDVYSEEFHIRLEAFIADLERISRKHGLIIESGDRLGIDEFDEEAWDLEKAELLEEVPGWALWFCGANKIRGKR